MNKIKKRGGEEEVGNEIFQIPSVKNGEARRMFCEFLRKRSRKKTQSPAWRAMTFMIIMRAPGCSEVPPDKFSKVSLIG